MLEQAVNAYEQLLPLMDMPVNPMNYNSDEDSLSSANKVVNNGESHLEFEYAKTELAYCYILVGRLVDAKHLLNFVGKEIYLLVGLQHIYTARSIFVLGYFKHVIGKFYDSNVLYAQSEDILKQIVGMKHPFVVQLILASSDNFRCPGYFEEAVQRLNQSFTIASSMYEKDSIMVNLALVSRAVLMRDLGDLAEAAR